MQAQSYSQTADIPLVACSACEKRPLMVIKSVSPRRAREADVQFVCTTCGATQTEVAEI